MDGTWKGPGSVLGPSWSYLELPLGLSRVALVPPWALLGAAMGQLGTLLGHLGAIWGPS